jgi:hypothetical protein
MFQLMSVIELLANRRPAVIPVIGVMAAAGARSHGAPPGVPVS